MISPKPLRFAIGCSTGVLTVWQFRQIPQQRFELFADAQAPTAAGAAPQAVVSLCSTVFPPMESRSGLSCHSGFVILLKMVMLSQIRGVLLLPVPDECQQSS